MTSIIDKNSCIILKNYIKPQQVDSACWTWTCCIILKNYIKPQLVGVIECLADALYNIEKLHQTTTLYDIYY